jgi:hypothetical protein
MRAALFAFAVLGTCGLAWADVESGPTTGEKVPELKVQAVEGMIEDKEVDYAAERKDSPTVYLFVDRSKFSRPIARLMKTLDEKLPGEVGGTYIVAVWLTDDVEKTKEYLPVAQQSLGFGNTALTYFNGLGGPTGWGVNSSADLTVVVANQGKVVAHFGFVSVNETLARRVMSELKKSVDGK